jgi:asparagine synthase (glutamine-hydrolysing)
MSGICGICQRGREFVHGALQPMFSAIALPMDDRPVEFAGADAALGVVPHWQGQQLATIPGVRVALDSDLLNIQNWDASLTHTGMDPGQMTLAERVAWLYALLGMAFLDRLEGAFSLALWDEKRQRLVLAIDRMGMHSLCWRQDGDRLLFASRVGALRAVQSAPAEIDPAAVMQYLLFTVVPAPLGIYRGVQKLRPGRFLIFEACRVREHQYWEMEYAESQNGDAQFWARELKEGIRTAVHRGLEGCEPESSGAYLSGGTDSSSVVAFSAERISPVNTFSIFFAEERYSEVGYARITANRFRTKHYERRVTAQDALNAIPKICAYYDEPFANSSAIGTYFCAVMARENGINTLLAGDGGDELFAGNERYASDRRFAFYHRFPAWLRRGWVEPLASLLPKNESWLNLPRRYVQRARIPNPRRIFSYGPFFSTPPEEIFEPDFLAAVPPEEWMLIADAHYYHHREASELNRMMYLDLKLILADNDLRKVLGTAELAGIRPRFPLLDHRLAELTGRIPSSLKMRGAQKRYIFKRAMQGVLPDEVLTKKKHGFGVPLGLWLQQEPSLRSMMRNVLDDRRAQQRGYVRRQFLDRLLSKQTPEHAAFYGEAVWSLLALELWHRQHSESPLRSTCVL